MKSIKVHISSCSSSESFYGEELKRISKLSEKYSTWFVDEPEEANIILVVDISNENLFENLRKNKIWRKYPNKSFGIYEGDCAPIFLHGLYSDARKSTFNFNRFLGLDYHMHQICFPNPVPDYRDVHISKKDLLYSFAGRVSHKLRKKLLNSPYPQDQVQLIDTSVYNHFDSEGQLRSSFQQSYWELAFRSKYVLCPKGAAASSVRLFEMMEAGIAPVIISDDWIPPCGPNWQDFALIISEKNIHKLYSIVNSHEDEWIERGKQARIAWESFFSPEEYWNFYLSSIEQIMRCKVFDEIIFQKFYALNYLTLQLSQLTTTVLISVKGKLKSII